MQKQISQSSEDRPKLWYVIFNKAQYLPFWQRLFLRNHPEDMTHITLINPVTESHALVINPGPYSTDITLREFDEGVHKRLAEISCNSSIISIIHTPDKAKNVSYMIPTCVSVVKYVLGFNSNAVTPKGLYNDLLAKGGKRL